MIKNTIKYVALVYLCMPYAASAMFKFPRKLVTKTVLLRNLSVFERNVLEDRLKQLKLQKPIEQEKVDYYEGLRQRSTNMGYALLRIASENRIHSIEEQIFQIELKLAPPREYSK